LAVTQRYTIWVAYSKQTQAATMKQVHNRIVTDFQQRYGAAFNVSNVFVPDLPVPKRADFEEKAGAQPMELYRGSEMFRAMTRHEKARYEITGQRTQARLNIKSIKDRYKIR
jgi:hypothetical protein